MTFNECYVRYNNTKFTFVLLDVAMNRKFSVTFSPIFSTKQTVRSSKHRKTGYYQRHAIET